MIQNTSPQVRVERPAVFGGRLWHPMNLQRHIAQNAGAKNENHLLEIVPGK